MNNCNCIGECVFSPLPTTYSIQCNEYMKYEPNIKFRKNSEKCGFFSAIVCIFLYRLFMKKKNASLKRIEQPPSTKATATNITIPSTNNNSNFNKSNFTTESRSIYQTNLWPKWICTTYCYDLPTLDAFPNVSKHDVYGIFVTFSLSSVRPAIATSSWHAVVAFRMRVCIALSPIYPNRRIGHRFNGLYTTEAVPIPKKKEERRNSYKDAAQAYSECRIYDLNTIYFESEYVIVAEFNCFRLFVSIAFDMHAW